MIALLLFFQMAAHDPLLDLGRFPSDEWIRHERARNKHARMVCAFELAYRPIYEREWDQIDLVLWRCDRPWKLLQWARDANDFREDRRAWMRELRRQLGEVSYRLGKMPPAVPPEYYELFR